VYDGTVSFVAEDVDSSIAEAHLDFDPVHPPEIPTATMPPESNRSYSFTGTHKTETFSQTVTDLMGGKQYSATAKVRDQAGNGTTSTLNIPYVREFENVLHLTGFDVSASYMPWNFGYNLSAWKRELPLLGAYDPSEDSIRSKHVDWANGHGINAFLVDIGEWIGDEERGRVLRGLLESGMKTGILWGPWERNYERETDGWSVDLSEGTNHTAFMSAGESLIESGFFSHSSYYRVEGRPVIFLYAAAAFVNERGTLGDFRDQFKSYVGTEPFLIGDVVLRIPQLPDDADWYLRRRNLSSYDALTSWAGLIKWPNKETQYVSNYERYYERSLSEWRTYAKGLGLHFVPTVIPGFDNTYSWGPVGSLPYTRSVEKFQERLRIASKYVDELKMIRIDTWNDFGEWTYIEPSDKTGFDYLHTLKNAVT
jgi:hypothetical protein